MLDLIVAKRLARRLTTVIDTTGLEAKRRAAWRAVAARHGVAAYAVLFDTAAAEVRRRNRARGERPSPARSSPRSCAEAEDVAERLGAEGFAGVHRAGPVALVPPAFLTAPAAAVRQEEDPMTLDFGLQIPRFEFPGHPATTAESLAAFARAAEEAGFTSLWVMDHFLQIPQVGREWEDMLESYTTLGLPRRRDRAHPARHARHRHHVPQPRRTSRRSSPRSTCSPAAARCAASAPRGSSASTGSTAGSSRRSPERYARLEDALELLPLMWGPGSPRFEGRTVTVEEAICYPRPLQERIPILVGGSGERRTLRLVARHADACNLFGDPATVRRKVAVLHEHCAAEGRDPAAVRITHLAAARVVGSEADRRGPVDATVDEHVGRYRELAEAGVQTAIVGLADTESPESVSRFADVIGAFAPR